MSKRIGFEHSMRYRHVFFFTAGNLYQSRPRDLGSPPVDRTSPTHHPAYPTQGGRCRALCRAIVLCWAALGGRGAAVDSGGKVRRTGSSCARCGAGSGGRSGPAARSVGIRGAPGQLTDRAGARTEAALHHWPFTLAWHCVHARRGHRLA